VAEQETAEPLNLPATRGDGEVEAKVFDGELVEEDRAPGAPPSPPVRAVIVRRPAHAVARHAGYVAAGAVVAYRRRQQGNTLARQMARQLAQQGNHAGALEVLAHEAEQRQKRHDRWRGRADTLVMLARNWKPVTFVTLGGMLAFGMAIGDPAEPFHAAADLARLAADALRVGVFAGPAGALIALHELGRRAGDLAPGWSVAAKQADQDRGLVVTADGIVVALQNLPIAELKKAFKDKWTPAFRLTPVKDGEGYSAVFSVPMGVTPEMIADKNEIFARNLHRAKVEVWPTDAERDGVAAAGFVNLWVANPGVLDRPAPEWPLLHDGTADVFKGVPVGVTARGLPVSIPVVGNNFSIGGLMGQGKSNACRVVMLGAALDPLAELLVHVFAYNGDFDCFEPRLARYVKGAEEEQVDAAMETLGDLYRIVGEREQMISDLGAKKVTRQIAQKYPELRPRLTLFSECHELFGHKDYGEEATELAVKTIRRARKCALWMGFDTQDARADAIPPKLLSLVSIRSCLPVTSWRANDGFLWDGAFKSGVRATELRAGRDIGRSLTTGVSNEQFEIVKWHYIFSDDDTGADDAKPVIGRSMRNLAPGTAVSGSMPAAIVVRDLLDDLAEVIDGPWRVNVNDLPGRLKRLDQTWPEYRKLTGAQLRKRLTDLGVKTTNTDNKPELDPAELHRAIAARERNE
jgi:DNA segregation ATPase FtsK/SpoIIIE, S-DNA-T family